MARFVDRRWRVEVGTNNDDGTTSTGIDVSALDVKFGITKDVTHQPNKAEVTIYNLGRQHRAEIASATSGGNGAFVRVLAGYREPGPTQLFVGVVRKVKVDVGTADVATVLEASDRGNRIRSSRISRSFAPGTTVEAVLRAIAADLDVGTGNLDTYVPGLALANGETTFPEGYAVHGSAARALNTLLRGSNFRWSINDGVLQLRPIGGPAVERAVLLTPETGLIGSPVAEERGMISITSLLQPGLIPGAKVVVRSSEIEGGYYVREVSYKGETRGTEWDAVCRLKPY